MFGHHHVAGHKETVLTADLFQRPLNHLGFQSTRFGRGTGLRLQTVFEKLATGYW